MKRALVSSLFLLIVCAVCGEPDRAFGAKVKESSGGQYLVGCGSADITGPAAGFPMEGFVRLDQISEGIHLRQRARAFIIGEPAGGKRIVFVCAELGKIHAELYGEVLTRLKQRYSDLYSIENVVLSATHTHGGAGGQWRYGADGPIGTGFFPERVATIAAGIESAIVAAHEQLQLGNLLIASGDVSGASAQRSRIAYLNNPKSERAHYAHDTDLKMTLLKLVGGQSGNEELGTVNWFAVHPTSMTYHNRLLSGDSKGYASNQFERQMNFESKRPHEFVAAFAQSNCGDVTGNLNLNNTGPGSNDFESTRIIGQRQLDVALQLYEKANEKVSGPIDMRQCYVDFSNLTVDGKFTKNGSQLTSVAAYGYSFAAGSTEDGGGHPLFQEGMKERNPAIDLLSYQMFPDYQPDDHIRQLQHPKAILFAPGAAKLNPGLAQALPLSVCRIGQLVIVVGPAEFTTMSGRRIRQSVQEVFGNEVKHVVIAGYSNAYGGYVSTREEYEMQQYEGGHTLFGPWTQAGYQQEYVRLARAIVEGDTIDPGPVPDGEPIAVKLRSICLGVDITPENAEIGEIIRSPNPKCTRGQRVEASFWTGHPRNSFHTGGNFLSVQRHLDGAWTTVYTDANWETRCRWQPSKDALKPCRITVAWDIPTTEVPGEYRIVHHGRFRREVETEPLKFESASDTFRVE